MILHVPSLADCGMTNHSHSTEPHCSHVLQGLQGHMKLESKVDWVEQDLSSADKLEVARACWQTMAPLRYECT